jgi:hypothetical protein
MQTRVISDLTVQTPYSRRKTNVLDLAKRRLGGGHLLEVERAMFGGGKRDVLEVARVTSWRWQERRLGGGKSDVKRYQLRRGCYGSDTLGGGKRDVLEVARETSWRWQERHLGGGKRDV